MQKNNAVVWGLVSKWVIPPFRWLPMTSYPGLPWVQEVWRESEETDDHGAYNTM